MSPQTQPVETSKTDTTKVEETAAEKTITKEHVESGKPEVRETEKIVEKKD